MAEFPINWIRIPGGTFEMGSLDGFHKTDGEGPVRSVRLDPYRMSATAITNQQFAEFSRETGWISTAEKFGWSYIFEPEGADNFRPGSWWKPVDGANWKEPEGPGTGIADRMDHPVIHVSWFDATAYAEWAGGRLPTEAQWEFAARGGRQGKRYPWGDELEPDGSHRCNVWQGEFPARNTLADGYAATCPADAFPPNDYGLFNCIGNVWEWCADWFSRDYHAVAMPADGGWKNPLGPPFGEGKVLRGGSFLCHASYCGRNTVSGRSASAPDMSTAHIGFRLAAACRMETGQ